MSVRTFMISIAALALLAAPAAAQADVLERVSPAPKSYLDGADFAEMVGSGSGDVIAPLTAVDLLVPSPTEGGSSSGCEADDFAGFPAGNIALLQRGRCLFADKASNAQAAGATAVVIFNEGDSPDRSGYFQGTLLDMQASVPVLGTTFAVGDELRNGVLNGPTGVVAHVATDGVSALDAPARLNHLMYLVENSAMPNGTKDSLNAKLVAARSSLENGRTAAACAQVSAFENQVEAQTGQAIDQEDAELLLANAGALRNSLGCT